MGKRAIVIVTILILIGLLLLTLASRALAEGGGGEVSASFSVSGDSPTATPTNNPTATPTSIPCPGDIHEEDDACPNASWISTDGIPQTHTFHDPCDLDWVKFEAVAGDTYTIITSNLTPGTDTILVLYPADIFVDPYTPLLAKGDDYDGSGWASRIVWHASESGTYYVKVIELFNSPRSCFGYDISVEKAFKVHKVYLPVVVN